MYNNRPQSDIPFEPTDKQLNELHKNLTTLTTAITRRLSSDFHASAELTTGQKGGVNIGIIVDGTHAGMRGYIELEERMFPEDGTAMPEGVATEIAEEIVAGTVASILSQTDGSHMAAM